MYIVITAPDMLYETSISFAPYGAAGTCLKFNEGVPSNAYAPSVVLSVVGVPDPPIFVRPVYA